MSELGSVALLWRPRRVAPVTPSAELADDDALLAHMIYPDETHALCGAPAVWRTAERPTDRAVCQVCEVLAARSYGVARTRGARELGGAGMSEPDFYRTNVENWKRSVTAKWDAHEPGPIKRASLRQRLAWKRYYLRERLAQWVCPYEIR